MPRVGRRGSIERKLLKRASCTCRESLPPRASQDEKLQNVVTLPTARIIEVLENIFQRIHEHFVVESGTFSCHLMCSMWREYVSTPLYSLPKRADFTQKRHRKSKQYKHVLRFWKLNVQKYLVAKCSFCRTSQGRETIASSLPKYVNAVSPFDPRRKLPPKTFSVQSSYGVIWRIYLKTFVSK